MSVICYMSVICLVLGGVVRVRLLCALLEVWVLGVEMSTLGAQTVCTPRIGGSKYRWPWSMYLFCIISELGPQ
jgi:hypothetical protein